MVSKKTDEKQEKKRIDLNRNERKKQLKDEHKKRLIIQSPVSKKETA